MPIQLFALFVAASLIIAFLGRNRRFGFWGYFFASLLFTPFLGLLLFLATDGPFLPPASRPPT